MMRIGCVVKAAGRSRRYGGNKLLAPLGEKPVLAWVLDALPRDSFCNLTVVASDEKVAALCRERGVPPLLYGGGPVSETIRTGLREMRDTDGCLFVSGDQPLCRRDSVLRLLDAFAREPDRVVRLGFRGEPGSPVLFPKRLYPALSGLRGEQGGMSAVSKEEPVRVVQAEDAFELWDADTPDALEKLARCLELL